MFTGLQLTLQIKLSKSDVTKKQAYNVVVIMERVWRHFCEAPKEAKHNKCYAQRQMFFDFGWNNVTLTVVESPLTTRIRDRTRVCPLDHTLKQNPDTHRDSTQFMWRQRMLFDLHQLMKWLC